MTETKLLQKKELSKDYIDLVLKKSIKDFFEYVNVTSDCDLIYKIARVEGDIVHVLFTWIKDFENYDTSCNSCDEVKGKLSTAFDFSKPKELLIDSIVDELAENIIVNF